MNGRVRRVLLAVVLLGLLGPVTRGYAQRFTAAPITLRIEGFVGAKAAGQVPQATWVVRVRERQYTLQVMRLDVLAGNTGYFNVIAALEPYQYAFTVYGDDDALRMLTEAPPTQTLVIIGSAQLAQLPGLFFIGSIEVKTVPTLTPSPVVGG